MPKQTLDTKSRKNRKFTPNDKKNDSQVAESKIENSQNHYFLKKASRREIHGKSHKNKNTRFQDSKSLQKSIHIPSLENFLTLFHRFFHNFLNNFFPKPSSSHFSSLFFKPFLNHSFNYPFSSVPYSFLRSFIKFFPDKFSTHKLSPDNFPNKFFPHEFFTYKLLNRVSNFFSLKHLKRVSLKSLSFKRLSLKILSLKYNSNSSFLNKFLKTYIYTSKNNNPSIDSAHTTNTTSNRTSITTSKDTSTPSITPSDSPNNKSIKFSKSTNSTEPTKSTKSTNYIQNQIHSHIHKYKNNPEYQKVFHLLMIKFLLTFNFILIQTTKDTLIVSSSGAEIIPVLKGGPVIIASIFFTWLYSKLSKKLSRDQLFTSVLGFFIAFYSIYAIILMPFRDYLTPHEMGQSLLNLVGEKRQFIAMAFINWIDVLFFIVTELWSTMVLLVSFWGFANQISSIQEAKKFYGILPIAGHVSLIIGGGLVAIISSKFLNLSFFVSTQILLGIFCIFTFIALAIFKKSYKKYAKPIKPTKTTKERSFIKSMQQIWLNKPLRIIATITICYGFSVNMIEMGWKAYMKEFFNDPKFYQATVGMTYSATGLSSLLFSILFGRSIISKIGWYRASQLTPIIAAITTILFCAIFAINHIYSLSLAVIVIGALHNILLKTMKLSLFDPTREMIYIPLGEDEKTSGKAAIDVFCFRLGKSSSSWVQILLIEFVGFGSFLAAFDSAIIIVAVVLFGWIMSIKSLKKEKSFDGL